MTCKDTNTCYDGIVTKTMDSKKPVDPAVSKYMSELAKKRKHPYLPFKDTNTARAAAMKSVEQRRQRAKRKTTQSQDSSES